MRLNCPGRARTVALAAHARAPVLLGLRRHGRGQQLAVPLPAERADELRAVEQRRPLEQQAVAAAPQVLEVPLVPPWLLFVRSAQSCKTAGETEQS